MTTNQIIKISSLIKKTKSDSYRIVESITAGKKIDKFHQWANGRYYHGAFLIANKYDESYWFLLIEWKPKKFYLVLYPENRSGPIIEAKDFKIVDGSEKLLWDYIPRKQDGKNAKRLANFIKFYTSRTAEISIPKYESQKIKTCQLKYFVDYTDLNKATCYLFTINFYYFFCQ